MAEAAYADNARDPGKRHLADTVWRDGFVTGYARALEGMAPGAPRAKSSTIEEKIVFGVSVEGTGDGVPLLLLGVPTGAWEYMRDGKTHTFDLTKAGLPIKLILFGAADHAGALAAIDEHNRRVGLPYLDERRRDFSIDPKRGKAK